MKLYYSPGACSLAPHIAMRELGIDVDLKKVDLKAKQVEGGDYKQVNGKGYVPAIETPAGVLTEAPVILQYLADQKPEAGLAPKPGDKERYKLQEMLNFITSELHKGFGNFFNPAMATNDGWQQAIRDGRQVQRRRRLPVHNPQLGGAVEVRPLPVACDRRVPQARRLAAQGAGSHESRRPGQIGKTRSP
jgi:glutathione S-transferase